MAAPDVLRVYVARNGVGQLVTLVVVVAIRPSMLRGCSCMLGAYCTNTVWSSPNNAVPAPCINVFVLVFSSCCRSCIKGISTT